MEKERILQINCALCDTRKATEETLAGYDRVVINCAQVLVSPESRKILADHNAKFNCADVIEAEGEIAVSTINGSSTLRPAPPLREKTILTVNGSLEVEPGCEELIESYWMMQINGMVTCPQSVAGILTAKAQINGGMEVYPDGAILLKAIRLDRTFILRAREGALYHARRLVALDPAADLSRLAQLGVRLSARRVLAAEGLIEALLPLVSEQADITVLPDGCAFIPDDARLTPALLRQNGGRLYINGDLTVDRESLPCLDRVEYLRVKGDVCATPAAIGRLSDLRLTCQSIKKIGGTLLKNLEEISLTAPLLEAAEDGLSLENCDKVSVAPDLSPALLREKIVTVRNCDAVRCTDEQAAAILPVCRGCDAVGPDAQKPAPAQREDQEIVTVNCANYCM